MTTVIKMFATAAFACRADHASKCLPAEAFSQPKHRLQDAEQGDVRLHGRRRLPRLQRPAVGSHPHAERKSVHEGTSPWSGW